MQPRVEQDQKVNRSEYSDLLKALSSPVVPELCQLVMKLENTVSALAKIASENLGTYIYIPYVLLREIFVMFYFRYGELPKRKFNPPRQ